jgi:hypothetical protein
MMLLLGIISSKTLEEKIIDTFYVEIINLKIKQLSPEYLPVLFKLSILFSVTM